MRQDGRNVGTQVRTHRTQGTQKIRRWREDATPTDQTQDPFLLMCTSSPSTMAEVSKSLNIPQIDKLHGAANYHSWRSIATTFLDIMGVWEVVTGKSPKPDGTDTTKEASWVRLSQRAKGFILLNIDRGLMRLISSTQDAPTAWAKLEERFDWKTPTSLHSLLKTIVTLRCNNKREIDSHIEKYDELWQRLLERSSQATTPSTALKTNSKDRPEAV